MAAQDIDQILDKLVKDVEASVHALYRGDVRQQTAKARTGNVLQDARAAIFAAIGEGAPARNSAQAARPSAVSAAPVSAAPASTRPSVAGIAIVVGAIGWNAEEGQAVLKCIMAWLPLGGPATTAPETTCIAAGKMLLPTWGEREKAREAVRRVT